MEPCTAGVFGKNFLSPNGVGQKIYHSRPHDGVLEGEPSHRTTQESAKPNRINTLEVFQTERLAPNPTI
jgi:hypothetical protein